MQENTVVNITDEDFQYIVIRKTEDDTDAKSEKLLIGEKKDDNKDPVVPTGSAAKIVG